VLSDGKFRAVATVKNQRPSFYTAGNRDGYASLLFKKCFIERIITMGAKEIMSKKFETVLRGYKAEEVDEFLREVSLDFSRLQKENEELEKKLEVLADKIREYREDEDALKDALLGAQRQGNALIADSKRKASVVIEEAQKQADETVKKVEDEINKLKEKSRNEIDESEEKSKKIIETANRKAKEIEEEMNRKTDVQKEILHRMMKEIEEFKQRVLSAYDKHIGDIEEISLKCENDFIKEVNREYAESGGSHYAKKGDADDYSAGEGAFAEEKPVESVAKETVMETGGETISREYTTEISDAADNGLSIDENTVKFEINANEKFDNDETIEMNISALFGKGGAGGYGGVDGDTDEIPLFKEKPDAVKTSEMFFKKPRNAGRSKQLRFGGNSEEQQ
jgi:DivIVA domain-containing protein